MESIMKKKKLGFTMVELLVVLVIVAILAAVAAPIYLANVKRSIASDAVGAMSVIRQAEREYNVKNGGTAFVDGTVYPSALGVNLEVTQFFSNDAFTVDATAPTWTGSIGGATETAPSGFVITADGSNSVECVPGSVITNCAHKATAAASYCLQMDNSGKVRVNYTGGCAAGLTSWENY